MTFLLYPLSACPVRDTNISYARVVRTQMNNNSIYYTIYVYCMCVCTRDGKTKHTHCADYFNNNNIGAYTPLFPTRVLQSAARHCPSRTIAVLCFCVISVFFFFVHRRILIRFLLTHFRGTELMHFYVEQPFNWIHSRDCIKRRLMTRTRYCTLYTACAYNISLCRFSAARTEVIFTFF